MEAGAEQPSQPPRAFLASPPPPLQTIPLGGRGGWKRQTPDHIHIYIYICTHTHLAWYLSMHVSINYLSANVSIYLPM